MRSRPADAQVLAMTCPDLVLARGLDEMRGSLVVAGWVAEVNEAIVDSMSMKAAC